MDLNLILQMCQSEYIVFSKKADCNRLQRAQALNEEIKGVKTSEIFSLAFKCLHQDVSCISFKYQSYLT